MSKIDDLVDAEMNNIVSDLQALIRQPSVSARKQRLVECANLVAKIMEGAGIENEILYQHQLDNKKEQREGEVDDVPPIVYGEYKSKSNPNGRTILFYNHYDVQPEEPLDLWEGKDAFSGKVEGNYIFGRGSADDKGELITRIKAVEYYLKKTGDVPCNVKFVVEGEEEVGSPHLKDYLINYQTKFRCDGVIWESGFIDAKGIPIISLGQKGILCVELITKGPSRDVHSSLAVLIENPAWRLITALNTIRSVTGEILIKDWYKEVRAFTDEELAVLENEPFNEDELKKEYGVQEFLNNAKGIAVKIAFAGSPTCNISSLISGYSGEGSKTVLPATARAKLDFRLVPEMDPERQMHRLTKHLREHGYNTKQEIEVKFLSGEGAARVPISIPFLKPVKEAASEIYGDVIISVSSAGTGPMYYFQKILGAPCVCIGGSELSNKSHSPNESMRLDLINKTIKCMAKILEKTNTY